MTVSLECHGQLKGFTLLPSAWIHAEGLIHFLWGGGDDATGWKGGLQVERKEGDTGDSWGNLLIVFVKYQSRSGLGPQVFLLNHPPRDMKLFHICSTTLQTHKQ